MGVWMSGETGKCAAIFVLGMHRSGTSCLAGSLQCRGLHLGDVQESNPHNRRGNRESLRIMHLNNAVLEHSGGGWDRPPEKVSWTPHHAAERDLVTHALRKNGGHWGFKDPRTILVLPFWLEGVQRPQFIGAFRHPGCVAHSLHRRDRMPHGKAFALWHAYNRLVLERYRQQPFPLLSFDLDDGLYRSAVDQAAARLGLPGMAPAASDFFDPGLRRAQQDLSSTPEPPATALHLHEELLRASREGTT